MFIQTVAALALPLLLLRTLPHREGSAKGADEGDSQFGFRAE